VVTNSGPPPARVEEYTVSTELGKIDVLGVDRQQTTM